MGHTHGNGQMYVYGPQEKKRGRRQRVESTRQNGHARSCTRGGGVVVAGNTGKDRPESPPEEREERGRVEQMQNGQAVRSAGRTQPAVKSGPHGDRQRGV